jgi:two-component sensor histidine kinase
MEDLNSFLRSLCNTIAEAVEAPWTNILTLDLDRRRIRGNVLADETRAMTPIADFDEAMQGLTGWVVQNRQASRSSGSESDPRESEAVRRKRRENDVGAVMVAPLIYGDRLLGTVTAGRRPGDPDFTHDELELLNAVAEQAAIALHTQDLYATRRRELAERELLLREIHHRVRNNLSVISSLARLQQEQVGEAGECAALEDLIRRVHTMSLVHEKLHESQDLATVAVDTYLSELVDSLVALVDGSDRKVNVTVSAEKSTLDIDTLIPLGLITTELVSNSLQHAFPERYWTDPDLHPSLIVSFQTISETCLLEISDNGVGLDDARMPEGRGLGITLARSLALQVHGTLERLPHDGTRWRLSFPAPNPRSVPAVES